MACDKQNIFTAVPTSLSPKNVPYHFREKGILTAVVGGGKVFSHVIPQFKHFSLHMSKKLKLLESFHEEKACFP